MADHVNDTEPKDAAAAPAAAPAADGSSAEDSTAQQGDQPADAGGEGGDAAPADADANKADEGDDKGNDVQTRRHNKVNAAARIATKNAAPADEGGEEGGSNELSEVKAELADIRSREEAREDEAEISQIIADNPELKDYADKVRELSKHDSRKQVPIKSLFYEAAGDALIKIGARRASEANADAAETQQNGTSTGNAPSGVSVTEMSDADFSKMQDEVRLKQ